MLGERKVGNFKYSITPMPEEDGFQMIILSLVDPFFNEWQVEIMDIFMTEVMAEIEATRILEVLMENEMIVEEEEVV